MPSDTTILVVDDHQDVNLCMQKILESAGFRAVTASDGLEALAVLASQPVDLIIADIMMPRMNGYQLREAVAANPQWVAIPFIFLTARSLDSDVQYGKELGVDDYLIKPVTAGDLLSTVRGKLRRARELAQRFGQLRPQSTPEPTVLQIGRLQLECGQYRVWLDGQPVRLSGTEFRLLESLACEAGKVVPLPQLLKATHNLEAEHEEAGELLRPLIRSLRRKLGYLAGDMGCIENVPGVGYRLSPDGL